MKKFYFGNSISSVFGAPICQILSFGRPHRTQQHYSAEKRPSKKGTYGTKKWRLKVWNFKILVFPYILGQCSRWRRGGIHPPIFLIFEIRLLRYLEDPFAKYWVLGRPTGTSNTISQRNVICKNRLFTQKIADFSISFTVQRCQLKVGMSIFFTSAISVFA